MSSDLPAKLEAVKAEIQEVQRRVARAEYERDTAAEAKEQALRNLQLLGADSEEEALTKLERLKEELGVELQKVREELEASG